MSQAIPVLSAVEGGHFWAPTVAISTELSVISRVETNMRTSRKPMVAGLAFSLAAIAVAGCDSRRVSRRDEPVQVAYSEPVQAPAPAPPVADERSDCAPGAPPASLANAIDVLRAHCDRGRALAIVGTVGLMALGARIAPGRLAGARLSGAVAGEIAAGEMGTARMVVSGVRAADAAAEAVAGSGDGDRETCDGSSADDGACAGSPYRSEPQGEKPFEAELPDSAEPLQMP